MTNRNYQTHGDAMVEELVRATTAHRQSAERLRKVESTVGQFKDFPYVISIDKLWYVVDKEWVNEKSKGWVFIIRRCQRMTSKRDVDVVAMQTEGAEERTAWIRYSERTVEELRHMIAVAHEHNQRDEFHPLGQLLHKMATIAREYLEHRDSGSLPSNSATESKGDKDDQQDQTK